MRALLCRGSFNVAAWSVVSGLLLALVLPPAVALGWATQRLEGPTRYDTAVAVSQARFAGPIDYFFVATGADFPDALAAAPAAGVKGAPILLVRRDEIPPVVRAEITRLQPAIIVVTGGLAAISNAVFAELDGLASRGAVRLAGTDRYGTAAVIATSAFPGRPDVWLATGRNYPDALSGAPTAGVFADPILLANEDGVPPATLDALRRIQPRFVHLLGGKDVLPDSLKAQIVAVVPGLDINHHFGRHAGATRYDTSAAIATSTWRHAERVYLAVGSNFPDALAGAPAAILDRAPLLLSRSACMPPSTYQALQDLDPDLVVFLGGDDVLSAAAATTRCPS